jgi:hypothetical protein
MDTTPGVRTTGHPAGAVIDATAVIGSVDDSAGGGATGGVVVFPGGDCAGMTDDVLVATLGAAFARRRLIDAEIVTLTGEVAERSRVSSGMGGLAARLGETSPAAMVASVGRVGIGDARRLCRLADVTRTRLSLVGEILPPLFPTCSPRSLQRSPPGRWGWKPPPTSSQR